MEQLLERPFTREQGSEDAERLSHDKVVYLGNLAIRWEVLGINDPLTHLFQYIEKGDGALIGIEEDLVTDIAERLPKTPFVNQVGFEFTGADFVSVKDKVSMNSMTANNLQFYRSESVVNPSMIGELARAEVEAQEVAKLADWFRDAKTGAFLIFESLPIGNQKIAISRVYQKKSDGTLEGTFVSMHNPSVDLFNKLRAQMAPGIPACDTELEVLSNQYEFYNRDVISSDDFVNYYVGNYDRFLSEQNGKVCSFGITIDDETSLQDGLAKARSQPGLTAVYSDAIKALASGAGRVNQELISINTNLGLNFELVEGQRLTIRGIHEILSKVIIGIVSVIDRADAAVLNELQCGGSDQGSNYAAVSHYGGEAQAAGETYASGGCSEYGRSGNDDANTNSSERKKMQRAYNSRSDDPEDFGTPKHGVCIIPGCPSHGGGKYVYDRVRVGGCGICKDCHLLLQAKKSPASIYAQWARERDAKQAEKQKAINKEAEDRQRWAVEERMRVLKLKTSQPQFDLWAKEPNNSDTSNQPK